MAAVPATWDQVLARRVAAHRLDVPATDGLVPLVRRLCGLHAQLASAAEAAVWPRTGGAFGPDDVRTALADDRTLVKTWAMRGTLHLLPAADLPTWTAALGTRSFPRPRSSVQNVRAVLDAYGPFGLEELHRWSALDKPVLRRALAALRDELVELDVEGTRGWVTAAGAAASAAAEPSRVVRMLPGFDPYVVGALRQLDRLLPSPELKPAVSRARRRGHPGSTQTEAPPAYRWGLGSYQGLRARGPSGDPPAGGRPTRPRSRPDRRAHRARCPDPRPPPAPGPGTP